MAWNSALLRPDRFRGVVGMSVPFFPRGIAPPTQNMPKTDDKIFYQTYFQTPDVAEAEFERDTRETLRKFQLLWSGDGDAEQATMVDRSGGFFSGIGDLISGGVEVAGSVVSGTADAIGSVASGAVDVVGSVASGAGGVVSAAADGIGPVLEGTGTAVDGCGSCSLAFVLMLLAAGSAVAALIH